MKGKILKSKIAVAVDEETRWAASSRRLLEGELAVSYKSVYDPSLGRNRRENFQIRIGRPLDDGTMCTWKDAARLAVSDVPPDTIEYIADRVKQAISGDVVFHEQYDEMVLQMDAQLAELSSMVGRKLEAAVDKETLLLYSDEDLKADPGLASIVGNG